MTDARTAPGFQRLVALVLLLAAGILSLPLAAAALDGEGTENFILPAQLGGMAVLGAVVGYLLPGLAGDAASNAPGSVGRRGRRRCCSRCSGSCSSSCCSTDSTAPEPPGRSGARALCGPELGLPLPEPLLGAAPAPVARDRDLVTVQAHAP